MSCGAHKAAAKAQFISFAKAFPDLKMAPTSINAFGDVVVVEYEMTGTFKQAMGPLKPTNKTGTVHGVDVVEMKAGKAARITGYSNAAEFARVFDLPMPGKPADAKPADKAK